MTRRQPRTPAQVIGDLPARVQRQLATPLVDLAQATRLPLARALSLLQRDPDFALRRVAIRLSRCTPFVRARHLRPLERLARKLRGGAKW